MDEIETELKRVSRPTDPQYGTTAAVCMGGGMANFARSSRPAPAYYSGEDSSRWSRHDRGLRSVAAAPMRSDWEVSDQWMRMVFERADGASLTELERQCRLFDIVGDGTIAVPELRMALRSALSPLHRMLRQAWVHGASMRGAASV